MVNRNKSSANVSSKHSSLSRRRYNSRRVKSRRNNSSYYIEIFTFTIQSGNSANVLVSTLGNRPPRSNFRLIKASAQFNCLTSPTHAPALQMLLYGPSGEYCKSNMVKLSSHGVTHSTIRYPRSADWWPYNNADTDPVMTLDCVCTGPQSTTTETLTGILTLHVAIQAEVVVATCPTLLDVLPTVENREKIRKRLESKRILSRLISGSLDIRAIINDILQENAAIRVSSFDLCIESDVSQ